MPGGHPLAVFKRKTRHQQYPISLPNLEETPDAHDRYEWGHVVRTRTGGTHFVAERSASALSGPPGHGVASMRSYLRPRGMTTQHASQGTFHFPWRCVAVQREHPCTHHSQKTGWTCQLQLEASTPFCYHSGASITRIRQSRFDSSTRLGGPKDACPVYFTSAFLPGTSPDVITTGWYDGKVRVHDLRLAVSSAWASPPRPIPCARIRVRRLLARWYTGPVMRPCNHGKL